MNIRIVSENGKHKLYYVEYNEDGYVENIKDEVTFVSKEFSVFRQILAAASAAILLPVIMVNSCNKKMLMKQ